MIKVFAIEPEFILQNDRCLRAADFGYESGRLVGRVPKSWRRLVQSCLAEHPDNQFKRKRIEVLLNHLSHSRKTVKVPLDTGNGEPDDWVKYALSINNDVLDGVLVRCDEGHEHEPRLLTADDIEGFGESDENAWLSKASIDCRRNAHEMSGAISNLLRYSREVHFIDPYFAAESRHLCVFDRCFKIIEETAHPVNVSINFLYKGDDADAVFRSHVKKTDDWLCKRSELADGLSLTLRQWGLKEGGERFHERFVITERGGVEFGGGLDEAPQGQQTTTVTRLTEAQREQRLAWLDPNTGVYTLLNQREVR